jgi:hypothetical protein
MYEASDPGGIPWLRQGWAVRQVWLKMARERLEGVAGFAPRPSAWWDVWGRIVLRRF